MDSVRTRMMQLAAKDYQCSQILVIMGLEARGQDNPELVRAVDGLAWGCGEGSCTCGALTGGCCLISLFAGKGTDSESRSPDYQKMLKELVRWFWNKYGFTLGGIDCMAIRENCTAGAAQSRCWQIMEDVYYKAMSILAAGGYSLHSEGIYAS
jgi:hypothetical protein